MGSLKGCVAQYADIGPEPALNRLRTAPGRHPILGGGIGGLRQLGTYAMTLAVWLWHSSAPPT